MFVQRQAADYSESGPGVRRKILARGGSMMAVEVAFQEGARGEPHSHPHEQICYVVAGRVRFTVDGDSRELEPGDSVYVSPGKKHGLVALEEGSVVLDIFTPQREDFLR